MAVHRIEFITAQTASLSAVTKGKERELVTKDELAKLGALKARFDELTAMIVENSPETVRKRAKELRQKFRDNPNAENLQPLKGVDGDPTKADERYSIIRRDLKESRNLLAEEAQPILEKFFERLRAVVEKEIAVVKASEAKLAESYGLKPETGPVAAALVNLLYRVKGDSDSRRYTSPFHILSELGVFKF